MIKKYFFTTLLLFAFLFRFSGKIFAQEATPEATLTTNQQETENTLQINADTGNNTATSSAIQTGEATVSASLTTIVNTNINGESFQFTVDNSATSSSSLQITANTGNNSASNSATITTGNLEINTMQTTIGNTNIDGNNWYFGVVNLNGGGDYTLPNIWSYLDPNYFSSTNLNNTQTNNTVLSDSQILINANTGNNYTANSTINTGDINIRVQEKTELNETILGDNWLLIKVNKFSPWAGKLKDWWGNTYEDENSFFAWAQLPSTGINTGEINQQNYAQNKTNINIEANTGNNQASNESSIGSGDININANIFTKLNTTIKGNHWYYAIINVFGPWSGNLLFAEGKRENKPAPSQEIIEDQTSQVSSLPSESETIPTSTPQPSETPMPGILGTAVFSKKNIPAKHLLVNRNAITKRTETREKPWLEMGTFVSLLMLGLSEKKRKKFIN